MKLTADSSSDVCTHWPRPVRSRAMQRGEHALGEDGARRGVGHRDADPPGARAGRTGDAHQATQALGDLVDAGTRRVGTALAEPGDRRVDHPRVDRPHRLRIDAEAVLDARAVVLDDHVGPLDETEEHRETVGSREVDRDGTLVPVQVRAIGPERRERSAAASALYRDHVGAEIGELAHARGPGPGPGEVDDPDARERTVGRVGRLGVGHPASAAAARRRAVAGMKRPSAAFMSTPAPGKLPSNVETHRMRVPPPTGSSVTSAW